MFHIGVTKIGSWSEYILLQTLSYWTCSAWKRLLDAVFSNVKLPLWPVLYSGCGVSLGPCRLVGGRIEHAGNQPWIIYIRICTYENLQTDYLQNITNRLLRKTILSNISKNSFSILDSGLWWSRVVITYAKQHPSCPSLLVSNELENCSVFNHIYCILDCSIVYIHFRFLGSSCAVLDTEFPRASFAVLAACVIGSSAAGSSATVGSHPALPALGMRWSDLGYCCMVQKSG